MRVQVRTAQFLATVFAIALVGSNTARADMISYIATGSGPNGALSAQADFVVSNGQIQITLTNTLALADFQGVGQTVSDIEFTLSDAPGTLGTKLAVGQQGTINSSGLVSYTTGSPGRFIGIGDGTFTINPSTNTILMEAVGGSQPNQLITPYVANGQTFPDTNPGIDSHNPYTIGPATFTLGLLGVTANTMVTAVNFSFGTGPDTRIQGSIVPEPSSLVATAVGLLAIGLRAGLRRRRSVGA